VFFYGHFYSQVPLLMSRACCLREACWQLIVSCYSFSLSVFVIASRMSDAYNNIWSFFVVVLGVFHIWLLALIYLGVIYCYFIVCLGSVITTPTGTPLSRNPTVWVADGGDKGKCKVSVRHLAREAHLAGFATLRPSNVYTAYTSSRLMTRTSGC